MDKPEKLFFDINQYKYSKEYVLDSIQSGYAGRIGKYMERSKNIMEKMYNSNCLLVANGTVALELALKSIGIKKGDFILVPNISFVATINAIISVGAYPVFIKNIENDIFPNLKDIEECLIEEDGKIKCVILVHLYGTPVPYTKQIRELCDKFNIFLIEDNAQSFGSKHKDGKLVGSYGDISTVSFFSNKVISSGQGGALIFNNKELYFKANILSNHGIFNYEFIACGLNYSFNNLSAALLLGNLENKEKIWKYREKIYQYYLLYIKKLGVNINVYNLSENSVKWVFPLQLNSDVDKFKVIKGLNSMDIACREGMSFLPHLPYINKKNFEYIGRRPDDILLPIHTSMNKESVIRILKTLKEIIEQ